MPPKKAQKFVAGSTPSSASLYEEDALASNTSSTSRNNVNISDNSTSSSANTSNNNVNIPDTSRSTQSSLANTTAESPQKAVVKLRQLNSPSKFASTAAVELKNVSAAILMVSSVVDAPVSPFTPTKYEQAALLIMDLKFQACYFVVSIGGENIAKVAGLAPGNFVTLKGVQASTNAEHRITHYKIVHSSSIELLSTTESQLVQSNQNLMEILQTFSFDSQIIKISALEEYKSETPVNILGIVVSIAESKIPAGEKRKEGKVYQIIIADPSSCFVQLNIYDDNYALKNITKDAVIAVYGAIFKRGAFEDRSILALSFQSGFYKIFKIEDTDLRNSISLVALEKLGNLRDSLSNSSIVFDDFSPSNVSRCVVTKFGELQNPSVLNKVAVIAGTLVNLIGNPNFYYGCTLCNTAIDTETGKCKLKHNVIIPEDEKEQRKLIRVICNIRIAADGLTQDFGVSTDPFEQLVGMSAEEAEHDADSAVAKLDNIMGAQIYARVKKDAKASFWLQHIIKLNPPVAH